MKERFGKYDRGTVYRTGSILIAAVFNVLLSYAASRFGLPLYLDTTGTIFIALFAGPFPAMLTAIATNMLSVFFNSYALYYTLIGVLIAIITAWFARKRRSGGGKMIVLFFASITLVSGVLGMIFQWMLIGEPQFADVARTAELLSSNTGLGTFASATIVNIGLNLVDKVISGGIAFIAMRFVPEHVSRLVRDSGWKQRPLSDEDIKRYNNEKGKRISLDKRLTWLVVFAAVSMAVVMAFTGISLYFRNLKAEYTEKAVKAAQFAASTVNGDNVDSYIRSGQYLSEYPDREYRKNLEMLRSFKNSSPGLEYLYIYQIREDGCHIVFDTDPDVSGPDAKVSIGSVLEFEEAFMDYVPALLAGDTIDPIISDDKYGFFITAYEPIFDSTGRCVAYAGADVSMVYVEDYARSFFTQILLVFLGFLAVILGYGFWVAKYDLIYPVKAIARYTGNLIEDNEDQETLDKRVKEIKSIGVHTGDEIEDLYQVICKMAADMADQMRDIRHYADSMTRMQNGLIITMADMVENRDSDTGAHVQKTSAYVKIILEGLKKKGYYADKLTDKYMLDVEMSAPLHDVGKINIPDAVLNKPGKLTDEEYTIMKTHTTAGMNIMEKAISTVQGESYLKEARNMAAYHHERWDGKGYPEGLAGEVIPLSARVMAIADVFDALASPRVYKPAFPLDKALSIIEEGAGTQFDPKCVEVFMENLPEVKKVLRKYQET
ncbi:MAG: HD domain-containing protein [Lachnospiraceae bacterium]|nr:HD domain-containing protein [Lachnospiraceae bacterium]